MKSPKGDTAFRRTHLSLLLVFWSWLGVSACPRSWPWHKKHQTSTTTQHFSAISFFMIQMNIPHDVDIITDRVSYL